MTHENPPSFHLRPVSVSGYEVIFEVLGSTSTDERVWGTMTWKLEDAPWFREKYGDSPDLTGLLAFQSGVEYFVPIREAREPRRPTP